MKKEKSKITVISFFALLLMMSVWCFFKPADEYSMSERRRLTRFPECTWKTIGNGRFMSEFEKYAADQFPMRDRFRRLYMGASLYGLFKKDVGELYEAEGYLSKMDAEINDKAVAWGTNRIRYICERYFPGKKAYLSIIPDKNYYLANKNGYPDLDLEAFMERYNEALSDVTVPIELQELLTIEDYYRTDTHWKQENLQKIVNAIAKGMGLNPEDFSYNGYQKQLINDRFYGVYAGQWALNIAPDEVYVIETEAMKSYEVNCYDSGKPERMEIYDEEKGRGKDPYEVYLSGSKALITIENTGCKNGKKLVLFRDSFSSGFAPLFAKGYEKVTLVDIRYLSPSRLSSFVDFEDADILFLYSTRVLNHCDQQFLK